MTSEVIDIFPAYRDYLQPARFKVAYGGRGSAKTRTFCTILTSNVLYHGWRVVCFREIMESIADSVYQEFVAEIERRGLDDHFEILKTEIKCKTSGGCIRFSGIKASATRLNTQKLKGFSDFDAAWLEEANPVTDESWRALIPTMRKSGSEIWVSFNPENPLENTYQRFVADPMYPPEKDGRAYCIVKKINFTDNPRFPRELQDDAELMQLSDPELYRHVYLGEPVADNALSIIKPMWVQAAIDAHLHIDGFPMTGGKIGGFDVSGGVEGDVAAPKMQDPNAIAWRYGCVLSGLEEWHDENPNAAADYAHGIVMREGLDTLHIDNIGVGASVPGELRRLEAAAKAKAISIGIPFRACRYNGWTASESPDRPDREYMPGKTHGDMFANLKAQGWGLLADRFRNTWQARNGLPYDRKQLISIPSGLPLREKLAAELSQPRRESVNGHMKVESKKSLKKRGIPSHNLADAVVMAYWEGQRSATISDEALRAA
ncbi:PBSX family phage terminase large subunit [Novosphingobium sp. NBM11]|uniref:PBSX family phage terminase large subunit n=1 Tax=Novosphingobium sp. NBM11 TaxID=2596914 RepID=UPI0018925C39|nr:PBSX family phage terminase large subunit [Novosphingobium sp. NBM11]MBF5091294.1 PBSX family phage terminase large subunit [Novosphingobium sp. NBM11]